MSNIKLIDGVNVNLDLVKSIEPLYKEDDVYKLMFIYTFDYEFTKKIPHEVTYAKDTYKTEFMCQTRIKQILEKQNSKEIEI